MKFDKVNYNVSLNYKNDMSSPWMRTDRQSLIVERQALNANIDANEYIQEKEPKNQDFAINLDKNFKMNPNKGSISFRNT